MTNFNKYKDITGYKFGTLVVLKFSRRIDGIIYWLCKCECGNIQECRLSTINQGLKKCKNCFIKNKITFIPGQKHGCYTVIQVYKKQNQTYIKSQCNCGEIRDIPIYSFNRTIRRYCNSCLKNKNRLKHTEYNWYYNRCKRVAKQRHKTFLITKEQMMEQLYKQNYRCALTNVKLTITKYVNKKVKITASLDRIDSSKGYTVDNIQFLHKSINLSKRDFNQEKYLQMCKIIYKNAKKQGKIR